MAFYTNKVRTVIPLWIAVIFYLYPVCLPCSIISTHSGLLSRSDKDTYQIYSYCWIIPVPEDTYVFIQIDNLQFKGKHDCSRAYLKVVESVTNDTKTFCSNNVQETHFRALNNITVHYVHSGADDWYRRSSFTLKYAKESIICARADHFRCSAHQCIHKSQVCDRRNDCEDASDEDFCERGVASVAEANATQIKAKKWLMEQSVAHGWEKNTHRAITALYLAQVDDVPEEDKLEKQLTKELEIRQLELKTLVALLRNTTEPISISELSMFVNALTVTCHNPRQFHGYDLVRILHERVSIAKTPCPGAYLTLCNSDWMLSPSDVTYLLELLQKNPDFPFLMDIQAMTVMALSCIKDKHEEYGNLFNDSSIYNETIQKFIESQLSDGSFGNIYTTALVTQALISSGQESNMQWDVTSTVKYFKNYFDSESMDFLSVYLVLPLLSSRSLADIRNVNCLNSYRAPDNEIADVIERLDERMFIQYSLFIGDEGEVVHTIYLKMPKNSSAYDVMRLAQSTDAKYKFLHRYSSGRMYVYQIANITNDPEAGKFWLLYTKDIKDVTDKTVKSITKSPDKLILKDGEHLVMWYRTALI